MKILFLFLTLATLSLFPENSFFLLLNVSPRNPIRLGVFPKSSKLITNVTQSITCLKRMPTSKFVLKL